MKQVCNLVVSCARALCKLLISMRRIDAYEKFHEMKKMDAYHNHTSEYYSVMQETMPDITFTLLEACFILKIY